MNKNNNRTADSAPIGTLNILGALATIPMMIGREMRDIARLPVKAVLKVLFAWSGSFL